MDWFATHSAGILRGSMCMAEDKVQLMWIKFMAMANEAKNPLNGRLEFAQGQPYDLPYIAAICRKSVPDVQEAIEEFKNDISDNGTPRITVENDGTIVLNNWIKYQPKHRVTAHKDEKQATASQQESNDVDKVTFKDNVAMLQTEYDSLVVKEGLEQVNTMIDKLSDYKKATGTEYKDDAAAIRNWFRRKKEADKKNQPKSKKYRSYDEVIKQLSE